MTDNIEISLQWADGVDSYLPRKKEEILGVVVHRIEVSQEDAAFPDTPAGIERFFREHPVGRKATGGRMPYPIVIDAQGGVVQCVPLDRVTPHARVHNPTTIGVACIGDFRHRPLPRAQEQALLAVCTALLAELGLGVTHLAGHDELAGGRADLDKECPGARIDMDELRDRVAARLAAGASPGALWVWSGSSALSGG
jgi:hypothetical protein